MPIVSSGQLSLSAIRDEFGVGTTSNVSLRTLSAAAGLSVPDGLNEFYGLSAFTPPSYTSGAGSISGSGTTASPYIFTINWSGNTNNYIPYSAQYLEDICPQFQYYTAQSYRYSTIDTVFTASATQSMNMKWQVTGFSTNLCTAAYNQSFVSYSGNISGEISRYVFSGSSLSQIIGAGVQTRTWNASAGQRVEFKAGLTSIFWEYGDFGTECSGDFQTTVDYAPSCDYLFNVPSTTIKVWFEPI